MSGWRSTSSDHATGKKFLEKLLYVQHVDKEKDTVSEISQLTLQEHLVAGRKISSDLNFTEYSKGNLGILKSSLNDVIVKIKVYSNPLDFPLSLDVTTHAFVVFKTLNYSNSKYTWWSMEKNGRYIVLQQSHNKDDVIEKLYDTEKNDSVKRFGKVTKLESAWGTFEDLQNLIVAIWVTKQIRSPYHVLFSNCQHFASFVFEKFNRDGKKWSTAISATVDRFKRKSKKTTIEMDDVIKYKSIVNDDKFVYYRAMIEGRRKDFEKLSNNLTKDFLNSVDSQGYTLLEWATVFSTPNWPIDEELKKKGAETSQDDGLFRRNVFFIALQYLPFDEEFKSNSTKFLSLNGIDINGVNQTGDTALHLALYGRKWYIAEEILDRFQDYDVNVRNSWGDTPLLLAARHLKCDIGLFKRILRRTNPDNVNKTDGNGDTALHLAIDNKLETAVKELLLNNDVNKNVKNNDGLTALHLAIRWTNIPVDLFQIILHKSAAINAIDENGRTALHKSISEESETALKELLNDDRVDVDAVDKDNSTALYYACKWTDIPVDLFKIILKKSTNVNAKDEDGNTALHIAIKWYRVAVIEELLNDDRVDVDAVDKDNSTALHLAIKWTNIPVDLFKKILGKSADINAKDENGFTALYYAIQCKSETAVNELLNHKGVNVNAHNKNNRTALHFISRWTNISVDMLKIILQRAEINAIDIDGNTALQFAIINKSEIVAMELLKRKDVDVNVKNNKNETALDLALKWKNIPDNLMKILEKSANCNAVNKFGETALHLTVLDESKTSLEEQLLAHKDIDVDVKKNDNQSAIHCVSTRSNIPDTNSVNQMGDTELHLALYGEKWEIAEKILDRLEDNDVNVTNSFGDTPLLLAARHLKCDIGLFKRILGKTNSENVNKTDGNGDTALQVAIKNEWKAAVKELLQNKDVDVNVKGNKNRTTLHLAVRWWNIPLHLFQEILQKSTKNNINAKDEDGNTVLCYAIKFCNFTNAVIKELVNDDRVDVDVKNNNNRTALHLATGWPFFPIDLFKKILQKSADINAIDENGNTALHFAIMRKSETKVGLKQLLKDKYIYVNVRNDAGDTALDLASKWEDIPDNLLKIIEEKSDKQTF